MRMHRLALAVRDATKAAGLLLAVMAGTACELPEPAGAYASDNLDVDLTPTDLDSGMYQGDDSGAPPPPPPPPPDGGASDGGNVGGTDAGGSSDPKLSKLAGRYLLRMDLYSTAIVTPIPLVTIESRNLVSYLLVTEVFADGRANERMCHQVFKSRCIKGCGTLTTSMAGAVTNFLRKRDYVRNYQLAANSALTGSGVTMSLGYEGQADDSLPSEGDGRVWDVLPAQPAREGMLTLLAVTGALKEISCEVYNAQRFVSKFSGPLAPSADNAFGGRFTLDTSGSQGRILGASNADCEDSGNTRSTSEEQTARLAPANGIEMNAFWNCPDKSAWETALPAAAP